jgi:hypothetical protein
MIQTEAQYNQALGALRNLTKALTALKKRIEPVNPDLFEEMRKTYDKEIFEIQADIDLFVYTKSQSQS